MEISSLYPLSLDKLAYASSKISQILLTTTMPNMGRVIQAFEDEGMREEVKIMVGGAPVTQDFADDMGADGYGKDAIDCVEMAKTLAIQE